MKLDQLELLYDVSRLASKQDVLERKPNTPQQLFLHNYLHIYLMRHRCPNITIKAVLEQDKGSFTNLILRIDYMALCMETKTEADYEDFAVLKMLVKWLSASKSLAAADEVNLVQSVFGKHLKETFSGQCQELIVYLQYIGLEVKKLLSRTINSQISHAHLDPYDLIQFLSIAVPRVYYNLIIDTPMLGPSFKDIKLEQAQSLYLNQSMLYFARTRKNYRKLIQQVLSIAAKMKLCRKTQRTLLEVAMRYLFIYFSDDKSDAVELFCTIFESTSDVVKFSMSDELLLFVRICHKLKLNLLRERICQKHEWIQAMLQKIETRSFLVGHSLKGINLSETFQLMESFNIPRGASEFRSFEIFQEYSVLFFEMAVVSNDVNISLYYLGDFESKIESKKTLNKWQKKSGYFKQSMILNKKGLYMFEFDNSYSWVNSKTVMYQKIILSPEGSEVELPNWLKYIYEQINYAFVLPKPTISQKGIKSKKTDKNQLQSKLESKQQPHESHLEQENQIKGIVVCSKDLFKIKIEQVRHTYEFETNLETLAVNKIKTLTDTYEQLTWIFDKQATKWIEKFGETTKIFNQVQKDQTKKSVEDDHDREDTPFLESPKIAQYTHSNLGEESHQQQESSVKLTIPSPSKSLPSSKNDPVSSELEPTGKEPEENKPNSQGEIMSQPFKDIKPRRKLNQQAEKALRDSLKKNS